jgi:hypothetical protein
MEKRVISASMRVTVAVEGTPAMNPEKVSVSETNSELVACALNPPFVQSDLEIKRSTKVITIIFALYSEP